MADYFYNRHNIIKIIIVAMALILCIRLFKLQIIDDFQAEADGQSITRNVIYPARGALIDRKGKMILNNILFYNLFITPKLVDKNMDTARLCNILGITDSTFKETIRRAMLKEPNKNKAILAFKDLSAERVAGLQELIYNYNGFELQEHTVRNSPYACGGLVIGYTGEINTDLMKKDRYKSYAKGDYVGLTGLEASYEEILRGTRGVKYIKRDNFNRLQGSYKNGKLDTIAVKGENLDLYMDIELEQYAEKLLKNKLGSLVAIDPKTGGILAMVSTPSFDPNIVNAPDKGAQMSKMLTNPTKPLFNRAIKAKYPPGSTFKPLTALVALDEGVVTPSYGYPCNGHYSSCGGKIDCTHSGGGHAANLRNAMANSCNSYFCHLFRLSIDNPAIGNNNRGLAKWHEYMYNFGLGHPTGIDLPSEVGGYIPDSTLYNKMYKNAWNSCNNCMVGMGQGEVELTPIQMANAMCILANKGYYYTPHFVKSINGDTAHKMLKKYLVKHQPVKIADSSFQAVYDGMEAVVTQGTGTVAKIPGIRVCAKTGTVENYWMINGKITKLKNHSMFVCFAPRENPRIAVAVVVENSGFGATWAGPVASLVMEKYLTDTIPKSRKALEQKMYNSNVIPSSVYLIDSLLRLQERYKIMRKQFIKDSTAQYLKVRDSILNANKNSKPLGNKGPNKKNNYIKIAGILPKRYDQQ
jgi:penicillin-binding protein 2